MVKDVFGEGKDYVGEGYFQGIYAVDDELGNTKIGIARNASARLSTLNTSNAIRLTLIHSSQRISNAAVVEKMLHEKFNDCNVSGEWFKLSKSEHDDVARTIDTFVDKYGERHIETKEASDRRVKEFRRSIFDKAKPKVDNSKAISALYFSEVISPLSSSSIEDIAKSNICAGAIKDMIADDFGDSNSLFADVISLELCGKTVKDIKESLGKDNFYDCISEEDKEEFIRRANVFVALSGFKFDSETMISAYRLVMKAKEKDIDEIDDLEISLLTDFADSFEYNESKYAEMICMEIYGVSAKSISNAVNPPAGMYIVKPTVRDTLENNVLAVINFALFLSFIGISFVWVEYIIHGLFGKDLWEK